MLGDAGFQAGDHLAGFGPGEFACFDFGGEVFEEGGLALGEVGLGGLTGLLGGLGALVVLDLGS